MRPFFNIESFLPAAFEEYRTLISDAFERFISSLPSERQAELLNAQQRLPSGASAELRLVNCLQCCPTLHKLGQVLARDVRLTPALRAELQQLEAMASQTTLAEIQPIVESELGDAIRDYDIRLDPHALAEGSVAIAWPISWRAANVRGRRRAVLKIPRPGIRERVFEELDVLDEVAAMIDSGDERYGIPGPASRETFNEVRELLLSEVDFRSEQTHLARAAEQYRDDTIVAIPELAPFCTPEITAMSRLDGVKVTDVEALPDGERRRLAERLIRTMLASVMFARDVAALFHGDPHAGNLLYLTDGRLGIIDWSLAGTLNDLQRKSIARMIIGAITLDALAVARGLHGLAARAADESTMRRIASDSIDKLSLSTPPGLAWLTQTLDRAALDGVRFPQNTLLFRKALHTLAGVVTDVAPDVSVDAVLWSAGMGAFAKDLTVRSIAGPTDDRFAVRLSNTDLMGAWTSFALSPFRYWQQVLMQASSPRKE